MKEELENLYARKVIDPLEKLLTQLHVEHQLSPKKMKELDLLLLEKYLNLEQKIREKYYNTNNYK